jgi:hypothetical protein
VKPGTARKEKGIDGDAPTASKLREEGAYREMELDAETQDAAVPADVE